MKSLFIHFLLLFFATFILHAEETRLLRFPAIHGDQVAFSYAGDIYLVDVDGGMARKITSDDGYEIFPRFSPDGKWLAFTARYDGNTEVYLVPSEGGQPRRLTYTPTLSRDDIGDRMGPNNIVMGWSPDGKRVQFRSRMRSFNAFVGQLFEVDIETLQLTAVPLAESGFASYRADGKQLAFNRIFREFRTWKYYQGGMADDIWVFDLESKDVTNITDNPHQDIIPMWWQDKIFFISDRDRTMNLFVYDIKRKEVSKVSDFEDYDIKFPSIGGDDIVFEKGGFIYRYHIPENKFSKIDVRVSNDLVSARKKYKEVSDDIREAGVSPDGSRVLFTARGDLYTVPRSEGITYALTWTSGVHERAATYSSTGDYIAYLSDESGEYQVYLQKPDRSSSPKKLTNDLVTYIYDLKWSPDGKKILFNCRDLKLRMIDVASGSIQEVAKGQYGEIGDFAWSPDSRWVVYADYINRKVRGIYLYDVEKQASHLISDPLFDGSSPVFSSDKQYLLYISRRNFTPSYSNLEWSFANFNMNKIYLVPLTKSTPSPFLIRNDGVDEQTEAEEEEKNFGIDIEGMSQRVIEVPVEASNYRNLYCIDNKIYYYRSSSFGGRHEALLFDLNKKEEISLGRGLFFTISADNKQMLVRKDGDWGVIPLPSDEVRLDKPMDLSGMWQWIDHSSEWTQIFDEAWRQMRDFFYVENMHGVDWDSVYEKYAVMLPHVKHRYDLNYVLGEMIGELNCSHTYINTPSSTGKEKVYSGRLGAELERDLESGYVRIERILRGLSWDSKYRSPLQDVGVDVSEGEYILAVDGIDLNEVTDITLLLHDKPDRYVELTINDKPEHKGSRKVLVKTIEQENNLYYLEWVLGNMEAVEEATDGQVGYVYIPDMMSAGLTEFTRYFYAQLDKKGLIIDARGNGGGNVSPMLIERLRRQVIHARSRRGVDIPRKSPEETFTGPVVLLVDKYTASDGDLFADAFKRNDIGEVIGTKTWGGVIGISGSLPFIDGTDLRKPEFATYSPDTSEWIIEGVGVAPDIYVDNDPHKAFLGEDAQLEKAIELIKEKLDEYEGLPPVPDPPVKIN